MRERMFFIMQIKKSAIDLNFEFKAQNTEEQKSMKMDRNLFILCFFSYTLVFVSEKRLLIK
jgi:hypothetical protein